MTDRTRGVGLIQRCHPDWRVTAVPSADVALQELADRQFDVVISDLVMPGIDGRQFLKIMGDDYPLVPVILITSQGDDQIAAECIGLGAVNYVPKRLLADRLVTVLDEVVQGEEEAATTRRVLQYVVQNRCRFEIDSDLNQIWTLLNFIRERLHALQMFSGDTVRGISTAVREALLNAHFHGNLRANSVPLERSRSEYIAVAAQHKTEAQYAGRHIRVSLSLEPAEITFRISDDGDGFDQTFLKDLTGPPQERFPNGNGIRLMMTLMDRVSFNESGNEVTLSAGPDNASK